MAYSGIDRLIAVAGLALTLTIVGAPSMAKRKAPPAPEVTPVVVNKPDDPGCKGCMSQAASLFASGQNSQAADLLRQWTDKCPNSSQLHVLYSMILLRSDRKDAAQVEGAKAIAAKPDSVGAHLQYALALMAGGKHQTALEEYKRVTELDPDSYEGWTSLAQLYKETHEDELAAAAASRAGDLESGGQNAGLATMKNLKRAGKFGEAKAELRRVMAAEKRPSSAEEFAREALSVGAFDEAVESSKRASRTNPKATTPMLMMALALYCEGNFAESMEASDKLISLEPANTDAEALKALALAKQNKLEDADKANIAAGTGANASALVLLGRGTVETARGSKSAEETLHACLDADASDESLQGLPHALARIELFEVYNKLGRKSDAKEQLRALAADRRFPRVLAKMENR